jgi:ketosteroid isomerase-like protein
MKRWLLALLSAAVLSAAAPTPAQQKEVMAAMNAWIQATAKQDVAALQKILHDELTYTHSSAATQTKAEVLKDVQEGRGPAGIELAETSVRIYDNTALVKAMVTVRSRNPNAAAPAPLSILHVLAKGPQGWQVVARQATRPAPPAPAK